MPQVLVDLLLDEAQLAHLARGDEGDCVALLAHAPGAADAVDVRVRVIGDVVVEDVRHVRDVEAACCHLGRDQQLGAAIAERLEQALTLRLVDVAVDRGGGVAARLERRGQLVDFALRAAEDDRTARRLEVEDARERLDLVAVLDLDVHLPCL